MSRRTERLASQIRQLVADLIQNRLSDPRIPPITSITRVEVSSDLTLARVYVSVFARDGLKGPCIDALQSSAGMMRRQLGRELRIRRIPTLEFRLDESLQRGFQTVQEIDEVMRELGEVPEWERAAVSAEPEPPDRDDATTESDDGSSPPSEQEDA